MPKSTTRQRARRRYWDGRNKHQYECPDCGRRLSQLRTGFEVHHKAGDPDNNDPDNLVALCRACHNLREQKKPSLNEIELLRDQVDGPTGLTPLVETPEGATAVYQASKEAGQPQMMLRQIKRRKYVELEIDFTAAAGWATSDGREVCPILDEPTVEAANAIMDRYKDEKKPKNRLSALAANYGADIIGAPPMLPDVARRLARELRPLIMDEANWEPETERYPD